MNKSIGTKNESSLHRTLKFQYTKPGGMTEVEVGDFIADGINKDGEYIEVQTGSFAPLEKKVRELASHSKVRIVHPISVKKIIQVYDKRKELLYTRRSPLKGSLWDVFTALVHAPKLPLIKNVVIEVVLADITEKRIKDGKGAWRRRGISIYDKELTAWHESTLLGKKADFLRFVPFEKNEEFTVNSLAEQAGIKKETAQKALYVLTKMKVVKRIGKKQRAWVYVR